MSGKGTPTYFRAREENAVIGNQKSARRDRRQGDSQRSRPHGECGRGARHHGPERLGQIDARLCAGRQGRLRADRRRGALRRQEHFRHGARRAGRRRTVPRFPISAGNPRRRHHDLPAHGAQRAAQEARRGGAFDAGIFEKSARGRQEAQHRSGDAAPRSKCRFLRRREEAQRDPADGAAGAEALRCSTRPIPVSISTR